MRKPSALALIALLALVWASACSESNTNVTEVEEFDILRAPPSQDPDPDPTAVDPDTVFLATVDTISVTGTNFLPGDRVGWLLNGKATGDIATQSTEFVSGTELVAIIQVAADAEITAFDVSVRGGGKRKGVGTDLLRVEVNNGNGNGPGGGPTTSVLRDGVDAVHSDGQATYTNLSNIGRIGTFSLDPDEASGRDICVDFPNDPSTILSFSDWADLETASEGAVGLGKTACFYAKLHTSSHTEEDGMLAMDTDPTTSGIDDVQASGGKLVLREYDGRKGTWHWRLIFSDARSAVNGGDTDNGLCIRKNANGTWTVGTDPSIAEGTELPTACQEVDEYINLIRFDDRDRKNPQFVHVARFRMPFRLTVTPEF